jgi:hypothetical protein
MAYGVMPFLCRFLELASSFGISSSPSFGGCPWWMMALGKGFGDGSLNKLAGALGHGALARSGHRGGGRWGEFLRSGVSWDVQGRSELHLGDLHMVAMPGYRDLWPERRHLQTPLMACVQPPVRRPFRGFMLAFNVLVAPSGSVPGAGKGGRRWISRSGGEEEGLDRFSYLLFRVLSVKPEDCSVIFLFSGVLCNLYSHRE